MENVVGLKLEMILAKSVSQSRTNEWKRDTTPPTDRINRGSFNRGSSVLWILNGVIIIPVRHSRINRIKLSFKYLRYWI